MAAITLPAGATLTKSPQDTAPVLALPPGASLVRGPETPDLSPLPPGSPINLPAPDPGYVVPETPVPRAPVALPPSGVDTDKGRLATAGSQFVRGFAGVGAGLAKSVGLVEAGRSDDILGIFDEIDQGLEPLDYDRLAGSSKSMRPGPWADIKDYYEATPEKRTALRQKYEALTDPRAQPAYQTGETIQQKTAAAFPVNPEYAEEFWAGTVPQGGGSAAGFAVSGIAGRTLGMGALIPAGIAGSALEASGQFDEALASGATLAEAFDAAKLGGIIGTSEAVPITHLLDRLDKVTGGGVKRIFMDVIKQGTEEAIQEAFQTISGNLIASDLVGYDPERGLFEGSGEAGAAGFTVGALMQTIAAMAMPGRYRGAPQPPSAPPPTAGAPPVTPQNIPEGAVPAADVIGEEAPSPPAGPQAPATFGQPIEVAPTVTLPEGATLVRAPQAAPVPQEPPAPPAAPISPETAPAPAQAPEAGVAAELNRLVISTGARLRSQSGREMSPAPKIEATTDRKSANSIARTNAWLLDEAKKEVATRSPAEADFQGTLLRAINLKNLSQSDQDTMNEILFGDYLGATEVNLIKDEVAPTLPPGATLTKAPETVIPTEEAKAIQASANRREAARTRKPSSKPRDILQFIADEGGVSDPDGDLKQIGAERVFIPGSGKMVRETGQHPDKLRLRVVEQGYLPEGAEVNDFYQLVDAQVRTGERQFSEFDRSRVADLADAEARKDLNYYAKQVRKAAKDSRLDLTAQEIEEIAQIMDTPQGAGPIETIRDYVDNTAIQVVEESIAVDDDVDLSGLLLDLPDDFERPRYETAPDRKPEEVGASVAAEVSPARVEPVAAPADEARGEPAGTEREAAAVEPTQKPAATAAKAQPETEIGTPEKTAKFFDDYYAAKARDPSAVLLYRQGDFYEALDEDAKTFSREAGITLSKARRTNRPMAGVPVHAIERDIKPLLDAGHRVALHDPKTGKTEILPASPVETPATPTTEPTPAGPQTVIPGAERITEKQQAERAMEGKAKPKVAQKDADEGLFDVSGRGQEEMFAAAEPTPGLYSKALRAVQDSKTNKARGAQWRATLKNAGVKDEEMAWLGLDTFLQAGVAVTKADLEAFVQANQVELREVTKGGVDEDDIGRPSLREVDRTENEDGTYDIEISDSETGEDFVINVDQDAGNVYVQGDSGRIIDVATPINNQTVSDAYDAIVADLERTPPGAEPGGPTKFSTYTLPGGENYREMLLTLPPPSWMYPGRKDAPSQAALDKVFTGGHYDEPNVLAHIRFNERTDADGGKVLFIEEVQSDWHQKGRKFGYAGTPDPLPPASQFRVQAGTLGGREVWRSHNDFQTSYIVTRADSADQRADAELIETARHNEVQRVLTAGGRVPDAPFKKTWHELALRRMVRYAAENGFDSVAWTTGAQQADRYDLSKHLERIEYERDGDVFGVMAFALKNPDTPAIKDIGISLDRVEELFGKEIAERIQKNEGQSQSQKHPYRPGWMVLEGLDLKVGGEGMASFYDRMLPNYANKLGKKFGAKSVGLTIKSDAGMERVWALSITPALREIALSEGFPMFADKGDGPKAPFPDDIIDQIEAVVRRIAPPANLEIMPSPIKPYFGAKAGARGQWRPTENLLRIALTGDPLKTARHESIHALKTYGLFTDKEWTLLEGLSNEHWREQYNIDATWRELNPKITDSELTEEGIAVAYENWWKTGKADLRVRKLFRRIRKFIERLRNALKGLGYQTVDDVFARVESGETKLRKPTDLRRERGDRFALMTEEEAISAKQAEESATGYAWYVHKRKMDDGTVYWVAGTAFTPLRATDPAARAPITYGKASEPVPRRSIDQFRQPEREHRGMMKDEGEMYALISPDEDGKVASEAKRQRAMQGFIARGHPIDRAMRIPFHIFGGVDAKGEWKPGKNLSEKSGAIITNAKFDKNGSFSWLNGPLQAARAGLMDRYGLEADYITRDRRRDLDERRILTEANEILTVIKDANIGAEEAKVLQAVLTGEEIPSAEWAKLADPIRKAIDTLGEEAVSLGLVSPESHERNKGTYLHRVYVKHETQTTHMGQWVTKAMTSRRKKIIGDQFKGRGMFLDIDVPRLMRDNADYREGKRGYPVAGESFILLDRVAEQGEFEGMEGGKEKIIDRVYWPADKAIPKRYADYTDKGTWEARFIKGKTVTMWRDFTKTERASMGEILDARYTIAKTFMLMAHDLSNGRFYRDIATNPEWSQAAEPSGEWRDAAEYSRFWMDESIEWVKVPDTTIPKSGGKKKWAALGGQYVRAEIWRDLNELDMMQQQNLWTAALTQWKLNKALALDTPLPTPDGWTTMGEIKVGDRVFDERGKACAVLEVKDIQHDRPCYEVAFSDGAKIVADEDHWWFVTGRNNAKGKVLTTMQIKETLKESTRGDNNHSVLVADALDLPNAELPISPYSLGVWLGDGHSSGGRISAGAAEADEIIDLLEAYGAQCTAGTTDKRNGVRTFTVKGLKPKLSDAGLLKNKHIPSIYFRASVQQRTDLLQGMMDSDGWITDRGTCGFGTSSPLLRDGALEILRSLGYKPTASELVPTCNGKPGKTAWRIHFQAYADTPVFRLSKKVRRLRQVPATNQRSKTRQIVSISPVPSVPVRCIAVSSESHLYLAGKAMIPTHNTARSPVVHMNNVLSNILFMDMADVRTQDLVKGLRSYAKGDRFYQDAAEHGAFGGDMMSQEIRKKVITPVLKEIMKIPTIGQHPLKARFGTVGTVMAGIWDKAWALDAKMVDMYRVEDEVFRMATYMRRLSLGDTPAEAAVLARQQFLDYDIRAPWVNVARRSVLPFISYTYRAVPVIARSMAARPWKMAKYFTLAYGANALAYMIAPGDEDEERRSMRDEERGYTWVGVPRMMRMPLRDAHGNPVFLDIRRWIPAGDIFDMNQGSSAVPIPAPIQFGGPAMLAAELMLNRSAFTGKDIINTKTDDLWSGGAKIGDWGYKSWMPSAAWVPGSWYWEKIGNAAAGATDRSGTPYSVPTAVASSVGIKVKPQDIDQNFSSRQYEFEQVERELRRELSQAKYQRSTGKISQEAFDAVLARTKKKLATLGKDARKRLRRTPK